jgi:rubrerythrin
MAVFFKSNELYRIAMQMERNGLAFYTEVARMSDNEQTRAVYEYLATSEKRHLRTFKKMLGRKELSAPQSYKGEFRKYLKVLLSDRVFPSSAVARSRAAKSGPAAAIRAGINAEKDSILFYTELLDMVPAADRTDLDKILSEEKRHLRRLAEYKETGCL